MNNIFLKLISKKIVSIPLTIISVFAVLSIFHSSSVSAYALNADFGDSNTCGGIKSNNTKDLAGMALSLQYTDTAGTLHDVTNAAGLRVSVTDTGNSNGIRQMPDNWSTTGVGYNSVSFSVDNWMCNGHQQGTVLGHGYTSCNNGAYGWCTNSNSWALDCFHTLHPSYSEIFNIVPTGVPVGATAAGGYWDTATINPGNGTTWKMTLVYHSPVRTDNNPPTVSGVASCTNADIETIQGYDKDSWFLFVTLYVDGILVPGGFGFNSTFNMKAYDQTVSHTIKLVANDQYSDGSAGWRQAATSVFTYGPCAMNVSGHIGYYYKNHPTYNAAYFKAYSGVKVDIYNASTNTWTCRTTDVNGYYTLASAVPKGQAFAIRIYTTASPSPNGCNNTLDSNLAAPFTDYKYPADNSNPLTDTHYTCGATSSYEQQVSLSAPFTGKGGCPAATPTVPSNQYNFVFPYTPPTVTCGGVSGSALSGSNLIVNGSVVVSGYASNLSFSAIGLISYPTLLSFPNKTGTGSGLVGFTSTSTNTANTIGNYGVTFSASGGTLPFDALENTVVCTSPNAFTIFSEPYLTVNGGDSVAGSLIGATGNCTDSSPDSSGDGILSYSSSTPSAGSGTTLAAQALGTISGFTTDTNGTINDLTFASFGFAPCVSSSTSVPSNITPTAYSQTAGADDTSLSSKTSGSYTASSTSTNYFSLGANTLPAGKQISIYVNGNVSINRNITYTTTGWTNIASIPNLRIVATGDIYISPDVTQLDGVYIAKGSIYDCSYTEQNSTTAIFGSLPNKGKYVNGTAPANSPCLSQLTVNGSLIAKTVNFQRTSGNINTGLPAETINYGPEDWLAPNIVNNGTVNAIQQLSPVL